MPDITEHDSHQKRKGNDCEESWVDFLVARNSVRIHNQLKWSGELVEFEMCRRGQISLHLFHKNAVKIDHLLPQFVKVRLQSLSLVFRAPEVAFQEVTLDFQFVKILENEFFLQDVEPHVSD